jgi:uncharacterized protein YbjT (DUF2867 family)
VPRKILLAGATGLIGGLVLYELRSDESIELTVIGRRKLDNMPDKVLALVGLAQDWAMMLEGKKFDTVICALGTTIKVAGSKGAFEAIDFQAVATLSAAGKLSGAQQFILVSSVGADQKSNNFYLKTKGRAEAIVQAAGFAHVDIFRPGLLRGDRREFRLGERIGQIIQTVLDPLLIGRLQKYRSVAAKDVAGAMVAALSVATTTQGSIVTVHENREIMAARAATG